MHFILSTSLLLTLPGLFYHSVLNLTSLVPIFIYVSQASTHLEVCYDSASGSTWIYQGETSVGCVCNINYFRNRALDDLSAGIRDVQFLLQIGNQSNAKVDFYSTVEALHDTNWMIGYEKTTLIPFIGGTTNTYKMDELAFFFEMQMFTLSHGKILSVDFNLLFGRPLIPSPTPPKDNENGGGDVFLSLSQRQEGYKILICENLRKVTTRPAFTILDNESIILYWSSYCGIDVEENPSSDYSQQQQQVLTIVQRSSSGNSNYWDKQQQQQHDVFRKQSK